MDEIEQELGWAIRTKVLDRLPTPEFPCDARLSLNSLDEDAHHFEHVADPIYRRLIRDFINGAVMPESKVAVLNREGGRVTSLESPYRPAEISGWAYTWSDNVGL